jgi:hypothetical protein
VETIQAEGKHASDVLTTNTVSLGVSSRRSEISYSTEGYFLNKNPQNMEHNTLALFDFGWNQKKYSLNMSFY